MTRRRRPGFRPQNTHPLRCPQPGFFGALSVHERRHSGLMTHLEPSDGPAAHLGRSPGRGWVRLGRGVHRALAADESDDDAFVADLRAWQLALPATASFTHLTAARLLGLWLPPLPEDLPLFVAMDRRAPRPERGELRVASHAEAPTYRLVNGVRSATPTEAVLASARDLALLDLVVLIDSALKLKLCTHDELCTVAAQRRRGAPAMRRALTWCDGRSESAWESLLRILHITCGVDVEPQHEVFDAAGLFVARGDLWLRGTTMLHEYDGGEHLKRRRQRTDLRRGRRLSHTRWERRGYTSQDVLHQGVGILRDADAALGRPHDPRRIRTWHDLLRESLFSPAGTARFAARLGLIAGTLELGTA